MSEPDVPAGNGDATADTLGKNDIDQADLEAPTADAAEQRTPVGEEDSWGPRERAGARFDVNEADAADQDRTVELDEDDYR